ncbi:endonuclease [Cellvibrio zantedeschiae]|uniref:Endonuclease n=1 Tax=Cellvibrio zantedeschiae TaxID=1237077 RepID=A0ABQ3APQ4_9GAMM|nr:endonuclease/exonuclease/phosphatase family protein [Cellvibrio zantedeschiae]GGY61893.1 endonuclease [Cellvibrio zantedeschiae]
MTFNLRVPVDPFPNDWNSRLPRVATIIKTHNPDVLGVQEATPEIIADLKKAFPEYDVIGRGRNVDEGGEGTQIFYKKDRFTLDKRDHGTLQMSPTPNVAGSNGWAMQWPRIFTWVHLQDKKTKKFIYVFNTHFPLKPHERDLSAELLAKTIAERKYKKHAAILTGDFNACEDEASMKYLLGQNGSPIATKDTYHQLHPDDKAGTFHAFGTTETCKIDYIYTLGKIEPLESTIIKERENFASDHYAVTAKIGFK